MVKHPAYTDMEPDGTTMGDLIEDAEKAEDYKEALKVVAEMRKYQKAYFKDRKKADLIESKRLEAAVDLRLAELGIRAY